MSSPVLSFSLIGSLISLSRAGPHVNMGNKQRDSRRLAWRLQSLVLGCPYAVSSTPQNPPYDRRWQRQYYTDEGKPERRLSDE